MQGSSTNGLGVYGTATNNNPCMEAACACAWSELARSRGRGRFSPGVLAAAAVEVEPSGRVNASSFRRRLVSENGDVLLGGVAG